MGGNNSKNRAPNNLTAIHAGTNTVHGNANINVFGSSLTQGVHEKYKVVGSVCVPLETRNFFGRKNELRKMKAILSRSNYAVVQGMAGAGKTSISIAYLMRYCSGYKNLVWVDSETKAAMAQRFKEVAKRLGIKTEEQLDRIQSFTRSEIEEIYAALCEHPTILVFDNAEGYNDVLWKRDGIEYFLPPPMSCKSTFFGLRRRERYKVIVTTRYMKGWEKICNEMDIIPLGKLSANDCKLLITERLKTAEISDAGENWKMLADYYDYLPIAIESATGLISTLATRRIFGKSYTIIEFLEEFVTKKSLVSMEPDDENEAHHKIQSLWDKTFEKLESLYGESGTFAIHLLNLLAFLSSDGVDIDHFLNIMQRVDEVADETAYARGKVEPAVDILQRLSLVQKTGNKLVVHRLLQDNRMKHMLSNDTAIAYAKKLCHGLNIEAYYLLREHINAFGLNLQPFIKDDGILQALEQKIGMLQCFPFFPGLQFYEQIYDRSLSKHGPHDNRTLSIFHSLVRYLSKFGHHDRTVLLLKTNLAAQIQDLGNDDRRTLITRNKLADQLRLQGQLSESLNVLHSDWDRQKSVLGPDDPRTLKTRNEIAEQLCEQGQVTQCLNLLQSDWDRQKSVLGPDDPRTLETRNEIAEQLCEQGQVTQYLNLLQSDWDRQKSAFGPDDPRTLETRNEIAEQLRWQGKFTESLNLLQSDWDRQKSAFGPDDSRTLETRNKIVEQLRMGRKFNKSFKVLQSDWDRQKSVLGPDDPRTLETRNEIAEQLCEQGQVTQYLNLLQSDWDRQKSAFGPDDPRTLETRNEIAEQLRWQGKFTESLNLLQSDWDRQKSAFGPDDPRTLETRNKIATQLRHQRKDTDALNMLQSDWERQKSAFGPDDPRTLETRNKIAEQLRWQGKFTESLNLLQSDWDRQKSAFGPDDPRTLETRNKIAEQLWRQDKFTDSLNLLQSDWERQKNALGLDDPRTLETRNKIAEQLWRQDKFTDSLNLLQSDWERQKSALGQDDPRTLETRNQLDRRHSP